MLQIFVGLLVLAALLFLPLGKYKYPKERIDLIVKAVGAGGKRGDRNGAAA